MPQRQPNSFVILCDDLGSGCLRAVRNVFGSHDLQASRSLRAAGAIRSLGTMARIPSASTGRQTVRPYPALSFPNPSLPHILTGN